jgi:hypothetical protein
MLFDDPVGAGEQKQRHVDARSRLNELGMLGLGPFEDIDARIAPRAAFGHFERNPSEKLHRIIALCCQTFLELVSKDFAGFSARDLGH